MMALLNWRVWAGLVLAVSLAFTHFMAYRTGKAIVRGQWDAEKVVQLAAANEAERENRRIESAHQSKVIEAQNAQTKRIRSLQIANAAAKSAADSLRNDLAAANSKLSEATADAVREYAAAQGAVLGECVTEYSKLAGQADGHSADSLMLQEAWPK